MSGTGAAANLTRLSGRLLERGVLRYTPAGVPAIDFRFGHESEQVEAGNPRKVECEMNCVALGTVATQLAQWSLGSEISVSGFLAAKSLKNRCPVLHVITIEFVEGNENGFQTEEQDRRQEKG
ncbi:MAG: primosomal replication protein N [Sulfurisoma sp.]|nr:primosomal replication protein N [Sulfurisoma sp.]